MRNKIVMVYPQLGFSGAFVIHPPISLLYASAGLVKEGIDVKIFDARLHNRTWQKDLRPMFTKEVLAVGISVMSGTPIMSAYNIGKFVKSVDPDIKVVWGGPHATFFPDSILRNDWFCDYVVSGYAKESFLQLIRALLKNQSPGPISGVSYKQNGVITKNPPDDRTFEFIHHSEIPYHLIEDYSPYGQLDQNKKIFPIYSSVGCPYQCAFCSSPAQYKNISGKKWVAMPVGEVIDHIKYLVKTYGADYIYFIDDDSFVDLNHIESILDKVKENNIFVKLGFRGVRVNELMKMSDRLIDKLVESGTDILHIGAESGSDRILKLLNKNITVQDTVRINRRLAAHSKILAAYNFIVGLPGETMEDLKETRDLMLRLITENSRCIIFQPNKYRPLPGTKLFELIQKEWNYCAPSTLDEWAAVETEGDFRPPWSNKEIDRFCDLLLVTSYFADNKIFKVTSGTNLFYKIVRVLAAVYRPIALFRLKHNLTSFFIELYLYRLAVKTIRVVSGYRNI